MKDSEIESLGKLTVKSNQLEIVTENSIENAGMDVSTRLNGSIKSNIDTRLKKDFAFSIDFGTSSDMETQNVQVKMFDDAVVVNDTPEGSSVEYSKFDLAGYLSEPASDLVPTNINFKLEFNKHDELITSVSEGGTIQLGETLFENVRAPTEELSNRLVADASVDGKSVTLSFSIPSAFSPWQDLTLSSEGFESKSDLWSQTFFGKAFDDTTEDQQNLITEALGKNDSNTDTASEASADAEINGGTNEASDESAAAGSDSENS